MMRRTISNPSGFRLKRRILEPVEAPRPPRGKDPPQPAIVNRARPGHMWPLPGTILSSGRSLGCIGGSKMAGGKG
jgi:hypothetical protein